MSKRPVVVVGAGVIGLTVANQLQSSGKYSVTVAAEQVPGSLPAGARESTRWASPWAGANWRAWSSNSDHVLQDMELQTYEKLGELADTSPEAGIQRTQGVDYFEKLADNALPWYAAKLDNAKEIPAEQFPNPTDTIYGLCYPTFIINVPVYLEYLKSRFIGLGGLVEQKSLSHIEESLLLFNPDTLSSMPIVVNCTALGSRVLGGVCDKQMCPVRGQTLVVSAPEAKRTITRVGSKFDYVIPRGDGTVVLGGTAEVGSWEDAADPNTTQRILRHALELEPKLLPQSMVGRPESERMQALRENIISVNVGFRPMRKGGPRLETESFVDTKSSQPFTVVHCYGHAGFGYQSSMGYASKVYQIISAL